MTRLLGDPVFIVFGFLAFIVLMQTIVKIQQMKMSQNKDSGKLSDTEAREIQELHRDFEDLSKRVEALETILLDQVRKR
ncbi:hypothetical protein AMJ85_09545 [candidate division BRC1 bacterium SM23_51]|nr:MAG: hypothetical protein AMJ85_09545 [candidate division BRC1 bacterium SM23_51]